MKMIIGDYDRRMAREMSEEFKKDREKLVDVFSGLGYYLSGVKVRGELPKRPLGSGGGGLLGEL
jgi:hypothetical protein